MPGALASHRIQRMWSYKYANFAPGDDGTGTGGGVEAANRTGHVLSYNDGKGPMISAHSDPATVTINLWWVGRELGAGGGLCFFPACTPLPGQRHGPKLGGSQEMPTVVGSSSTH